jgi:ribosomal protein S6--L-glutamate ligase
VKLWLYSHLQDSPGNALVLKEAQNRGHQATLVRPGACHLALDAELSERPDLLLTRVGGAAPDSAIEDLTMLSVLGVRCVNSPESLRRTRHKGVASSYLFRAGVPTPKTVQIGVGSVDEALRGMPGPPWIVKLPLSTKGQGVCLVESLRSLRSVVDTLRAGSPSVLLQEFIECSKGCDIRVIVLGGKARLAARRRAREKDEFRSNVHLGGKADLVELEPDMRRVAEDAARALGLDIAGIDLLESENGYLVVEVNSSPGLTASDQLPSLLFDHLEEMMSKDSLEQRR